MLGMDVGDRRIGLAGADALGITAQGLPTLNRKDMKHDFDYIKDVINQRQVQTLVVGLPKNMDGTIGAQGQKVQAFIQEVIEYIDDKSLSVVYWDERLTTVAAHRSMLEGDLSRRKRRDSVDRVSAVLILQGYLDRLATQR
jgi:putative Holliday junction resolvase